jgi:hypothetical protein
MPARSARCYDLRKRWLRTAERDNVGEILRLGMTHYTPMTGHDRNMANVLRAVARDPSRPDIGSWIFNSNECFAVFKP